MIVGLGDKEACYPTIQTSKQSQPKPNKMSHTHDDHSHDFHDHGHSHEVLDGPGSYLAREPPIIDDRDWNERAFTVGIGGYVSPTSSYMSPLC